MRHSSILKNRIKRHHKKGLILLYAAGFLMACCILPVICMERAMPYTSEKIFASIFGLADGCLKMPEGLPENQAEAVLQYAKDSSKIQEEQLDLKDAPLFFTRLSDMGWMDLELEEGRMPESLTDVIISSQTARQYNWQLSSRLEISGKELLVTGIFSAPACFEMVGVYDDSQPCQGLYFTLKNEKDAIRIKGMDPMGMVEWIREENLQMLEGPQAGSAFWIITKVCLLILAFFFLRPVLESTFASWQADGTILLSLGLPMKQWRYMRYSLLLSSLLAGMLTGEVFCILLLSILFAWRPGILYQLTHIAFFPDVHCLFWMGLLLLYAAALYSWNDRHVFHTAKEQTYAIRPKTRTTSVVNLWLERSYSTRRLFLSSLVFFICITGCAAWLFQDQDSLKERLQQPTLLSYSGSMRLENVQDLEWLVAEKDQLDAVSTDIEWSIQPEISLIPDGTVFSCSTGRLVTDAVFKNICQNLGLEQIPQMLLVKEETNPFEVLPETGKLVIENGQRTIHLQTVLASQWNEKTVQEDKDIGIGFESGTSFFLLPYSFSLSLLEESGMAVSLDVYTYAAQDFSRLDAAMQTPEFEQMQRYSMQEGNQSLQNQEVSFHTVVWLYILLLVFCFMACILVEIYTIRMAFDEYHSLLAKLGMDAKSIDGQMKRRICLCIFTAIWPALLVVLAGWMLLGQRPGWFSFGKLVITALLVFFAVMACLPAAFLQVQKTG